VRARVVPTGVTDSRWVGWLRGGGNGSSLEVALGRVGRASLQRERNTRTREANNTSINKQSE